MFHLHGSRWSRCVTMLLGAEPMRPVWTRFGQIIDVVCTVPRGNLARFATLGLIAALLVLPGFALWGAIRPSRPGAAARSATALSDAFADARYAVGTEESLERKYRLQHSAEVRGLHQARAVAPVEALDRALAVAGADNAIPINRSLASHVRYLA